jgi:aryl-phospho-beta-D-glucosidase BglC (GH1 family)
MIMKSPENKAEMATKKNIFCIWTPVTIFDRMNEPRMILVIITTEKKSGTKGCASRTILFFFMM